MDDVKKEQIEFIKTVTQDIVKKIGIDCALELQEGSEDNWVIIKTPDAPLLIGDNGKHLAALTYVVKRIFEKKFPGAPQHFLLDINDYQKKHNEEIKDLARMHAQRVRYFKKEIEMRPMNAYDRRIVHSALQEYPDIATESRGEGLERRVIIKPLNLV